MTMHNFVWICITFNESFWLCMTLFDCVLSCVTLCYSAWLFMILHNALLHFMTMFAYARVNYTLYESVWPCMTLKNSFYLFYSVLHGLTWIFRVWLLCLILLVQFYSALFEFVKIGLTLFNSSSYAQMLCLLENYSALFIGQHLKLDFMFLSRNVKGPTLILWWW